MKSHGVSAYLVAQVGVDAHQLATIDSGGALHVNGAGAVARAVTAGSVDLAVVLGIEVDNVDMAATVVLDDLVGGMVSTAANDVGSAVTLDGDSVLADVLEPDKLESAGAQAVDTLTLVGANDDVAKGSALLEDEDGISLTYTTGFVLVNGTKRVEIVSRRAVIPPSPWPPQGTPRSYLTQPASKTSPAPM